MHVLLIAGMLAAKKVSQWLNGSPASPSTGGSYSIVDQGTSQLGGLQWAAVPRHQAAAFKAATPRAYPSDCFSRTLDKQLRRQPKSARYLAPFGEQVLEAVNAYPQCEVFVIGTV